MGLWPPGFLVPPPPAEVSEQETLRGLRTTLLFQAQQIEAYRAAEERLPTSLDDVAVRFDGVRYLRSSSRLYQLVAYRRDGEPVIYDSGAPAPEMQALARTLFPESEP